MTTAEPQRTTRDVQGHELRAWMTNAGWTVRTLAVRLERSPATIQNWISGRTRVPVEVELALDALGPRTVERDDEAFEASPWSPTEEHDGA